MVIGRGIEWGAKGVPPDDTIWFASDRAAANFVAANPGRAFGLTAGDLARTLGAGTGHESVGFPIDVMNVDWISSGMPGHGMAIAHVVARFGHGWRGPVRAAMNAQFMGSWDVAPRGHPNDGRVEILEVEASMSIRQRWQARRRLPLGTHVPHPNISVSSRSKFEWNFLEPTPLHLDGRIVARVECVTIEVVADGAHVWVRM
jgi:hypothetical protein